MQPPHHALPWPAVDPDEVSLVGTDLRLLEAVLASEVDTWLPRPVDWVGTSADTQHVAYERIRVRAGSVRDAVGVAAHALEILEQVVRSAQDEIHRIAQAVNTAEADAMALEAAATRAAGAAAHTPLVDPMSAEEAGRLRQVAISARLRATDARREADAVLRRAVVAATEEVEAVDRHDRRAGDRLDSLLATPLPLGSGNSVHALSLRVPAHDRSEFGERADVTRAAIRRYVDALAEAISDLEAEPWSERSWWESMALVHLREQFELHRQFLSPGRQMLAWDPNGDGRAVEVFGDLATARHIAVVVPGIMNTIENFDDQLAKSAKDLWVHSSSLDDRTAVVAWLGYDTPELVDAVSKGRAVEHESELRSFVESLPPAAHLTVVAHSYGTVLAAESAARGLAADDLVLVGSPGTRLDHASEADLEPDAQVFAGVSDTDWIVGRTGYGSVVCPEKIVGEGWLTGLRWLVSPLTGPLSWVTDSCKTDADGDIKGLTHGINPAHEDFGAVEISTGDVDGHSSYLDPGTSSLESVAQIVVGAHPDQH